VKPILKSAISNSQSVVWTRFRRFRPLTGYTLACYLFLYLPIVVLIAFSFNTSRFSVEWEQFTWMWYVDLIQDPLVLDALKNSIVIALTATVLSTIIGTLTAYGLYRFRFSSKIAFDGILFLPIVTPEIIVGISLLIFFVMISFPLGLISIIVAHVAFDIPFVMLIVRARLQGMDRSLEEASMDLGADELTTFFKITIPQLFPGIMAASLLAFTLSFNDFVITFFVTGIGSTTLPLKIYSMVRLGVSPEINALSTVVVVFSALLIIIADRFQRIRDVAEGKVG
jgi:spermidine/putrescine transport system permease protein